MSEGKLYQLYEFRNIDGSKSATPGLSQHGKFLQWNNTNGVFDYTTITVPEIPEIPDDTYLTNVTRVNDYGQFLMSDGTTYYLDLSDTITYELELPGDTKVLFDETNTVGGRAAFNYDYTNNKLRFQGTTLMFDSTDGGEGTYKEGIKYNGLYSWSIGHGFNSFDGGYYNINLGFKAGHGLSGGSSKNTIVGAFAGENTSLSTIGAIYIGAYAGKYENENNKFFLDNTEYEDTATGRANSFLYADLDIERRLYIRDRLSVEKEGKFGYSELSDAEGEYGMYQMSATSAGNPQWHDGTIWQDFATSTNTYLNDFDLTNNDLTLILNDLSEVGPIDLSSINTTTFATSPSSPATEQTVVSDYGYLQISDSSFNNNEGFTHVYDDPTSGGKGGLQWNNSLEELNIPGALKLATKAQYIASEGNIIWNGVHYYGRVGLSWIQLDNVITTGESNTASNVGTGIKFFSDKNNYDLRFFTLDSSDDRITLVQATDPVTDPVNTINLDLTLTGTNLAASSGFTYSGVLFNAVTTPTGIAPNYDFNTVVSNTIVISNTIPGELRLEYNYAENYTTASCLGGDECIYYGGSAAHALEFRGISAGNNIALTGAATDITVAVTPGTLLDLTGTTVGSTTTNGYLLSQGSDLDFDQKFIQAGANITITDIEDGFSNIVGYSIASAAVTGNTIANLPGDEGIWYQLAGSVNELKSLSEGLNIALSSDDNTITIATADITLDNLYTGVDTPIYLLSEEGTGTQELNQTALVAGAGITFTETTGGLTISSPAVSPTGTNNGSAAEIYVDATAPNFEFRTLDSLDSRLTIEEDSDQTVDFNIVLDINGNNIGTTSIPATSALIYKDTTNSTGVAPVLNFRPLINLDGTVVITQNANDEIVLSSTVISEVDAYTGTQLCTTVGSFQPFKRLNVTDFEFRGLIAGEFLSFVDESLSCVTLDGDPVPVTSISTDLASLDLLTEKTTTHEVDFKGILEGPGLTLLDNGTDITFSLEYPISGANLGAQAGIYDSVTNGVLSFKSIGTLLGTPTPSLGYSYSNIEVIETATEILIASKDETPFTITETGTGTGDYILDEISEHNYTQKKIIGGTNVTVSTSGDQITVSSALGGGESNTGANLDTNIAVYKETIAPVLKFKTFNASGDHNTISANADGKNIDVDVDDIILDYIGDPDVANPYISQEILQLNADDWTVEYKGIGITSGSGLTVETITNGDYKDIVFNQPILIPKFSFITTPIFTPSIPITQGLLEFTTSYDADVRDGDNLTTTTMFNLNIGSGLSYNSSTNTLYTNVSSASDAEDYAVRFLDVVETDTEYTIQFILDNSLSTDASFVPIDLDTGGAVTTYDYMTIEKYQLTVADYTDITSASGNIGGVKIYDTVKAWANDEQRYLRLDEITGRLDIPYDLVTYDNQNNLHDINNSEEINTLRDQARNNIGAAYINGASDEDFDANNLTVTDTLDASNTTALHKIGELVVTGETIYSNGEGTVTVKRSATSDTKIEVGINSINLRIGESGTSRVNIYDENGTKMFLFDATTGDLYVKGSIKIGGTFEAWSEDAQNI